MSVPHLVRFRTRSPLIFLSAAQRLVVSDLVAEKGELVGQEARHGEHALFRLWYVSCISALEFLTHIAMG
ncbi:hypothetical protein BJV78DRAFT_1188432 [Lactifluus subvellereus]|nr:hypothetical protein BJV78DRAFT_1188432 [Lactifluus subvellereus]